jgi:hypothetical protein
MIIISRENANFTSENVFEPPKRNRRCAPAPKRTQNRKNMRTMCALTFWRRTQCALRFGGSKIVSLTFPCMMKLAQASRLGPNVLWKLNMNIQNWIRVKHATLDANHHGIIVHGQRDRRYVPWEPLGWIPVKKRVTPREWFDVWLVGTSAVDDTRITRKAVWHS